MVKCRRCKKEKPDSAFPESGLRLSTDISHRRQICEACAREINRQNANNPRADNFLKRRREEFAKRLKDLE